MQRQYRRLYTWFKSYLLLYCVCIHVWVCMCVCICIITRVEVRRQCCKYVFIFHFDVDSGDLTPAINLMWQAPLPTEPSFKLVNLLFKWGKPSKISHKEKTYNGKFGKIKIYLQPRQYENLNIKWYLLILLIYIIL